MRLHAYEWGTPDGPPLVCVHGVAAHGARFRRLAQALPDRRLIAFDLRGHGRSGYEPPWDLRTHVTDLIDSATAAGVEDAAWLGASFGGRLVAGLAAQAPELVSRLVLLDPALRLPPAVCFEQADRERLEQMFKSPADAIADRLGSGEFFHARRESFETEMRDHLVRREDGLFVYRYCRCAAVAAWSDMSAAPPPVALVPTLFVLGARSWIDNQDQLRRYREDLGEKAEALIVPGGHIVLWDAFDETAGAIESFLRHPSRPPVRCWRALASWPSTAQPPAIADAPRLPQVRL